MHKQWKTHWENITGCSRMCYIKKVYKVITLLNAICAKIRCVWKSCLGAKTIPPTQSNSKIFAHTHTHTDFTSIQSFSLAMISYLLSLWWLSLSHIPLVETDMAWNLCDNCWVITFFTLMPAVPRYALTAEGTPLSVAAPPDPAGRKAHVHTAIVCHQTPRSTARGVSRWTEVIKLRENQSQGYRQTEVTETLRAAEKKRIS